MNLMSILLVIHMILFGAINGIYWPCEDGQMLLETNTRCTKADPYRACEDNYGIPDGYDCEFSGEIEDCFIYGSRNSCYCCG